MLYCSTCKKTRYNTEFYRKNKTYKTCNVCSFKRSNKTVKDKEELFNKAYNSVSPSAYLQTLNVGQLRCLYKEVCKAGKFLYPTIAPIRIIKAPMLVETISTLVECLQLEKAKLTNPLVCFGNLTLYNAIIGVSYTDSIRVSNELHKKLLNKTLVKKLNSLNIIYPTKTLQKYFNNDVVNVINDYLQINNKHILFSNMLSLYFLYYNTRAPRGVKPALRYMFNKTDLNAKVYVNAGKNATFIVDVIDN